MEPRVTIVDWPAGSEERRLLAELGVPRLLRIASGVAVPEIDPIGEDWFREPCADDDVAARARALLARREHIAPAPPRIGDDGVLRAGGTRCPLGPVEARLMTALLSARGETVSRSRLAEVGWPDAEASRNALDLAVARLRRRVEPLGVFIRTVRGRGYVLEG